MNSQLHYIWQVFRLFLFFVFRLLQGCFAFLCLLLDGLFLFLFFFLINILNYKKLLFLPCEGLSLDIFHNFKLIQNLFHLSFFCLLVYLWSNPFGINCCFLFYVHHVLQRRHLNSKLFKISFSDWWLIHFLFAFLWSLLWKSDKFIRNLWTLSLSNRFQRRLLWSNTLTDTFFLTLLITNPRLLRFHFFFVLLNLTFQLTNPLIQVIFIVKLCLEIFHHKIVLLMVHFFFVKGKKLKFELLSHFLLIGLAIGTCLWFSWVRNIC